MEARILSSERDIENKYQRLEPSSQLLLNSDVLSIIFIACSQLDWRSPTTIGAVNRLWRETVISTPRAWQFFRNVDNSQRLPDEQAAMWLFMSHHLPLHMHVARSCAPGRVWTVMQHRERFECLTLQHKFDYLQDEYLNLKYLGLFDDFREDAELEDDIKPQVWTVKRSVGSLNQRRFPALQSLTIISRSMQTTRVRLKPDFPPLVKLDLKVRDLGRWGGLIAQCADTLVSLTIERYVEARLGTVEPEDLVRTLDLPRLRHLSLDFTWARNCPTFFSFVTPSLERFETLQWYAVHATGGLVETANVTHLIYFDKQSIDLSTFPLLRQLFIYVRVDRDISFWESLLDNSRLCPYLSLVVYADPEGNSDQDLVKRLELERKIQMVPTISRQKWRSQALQLVPKLTCDHCLRI